jgi:hypothetical protein
VPTVQFIGRIYPSAVTAQFTDLFPVDGVSSDLGLQMQFSTSIKNNEVRISCEVNKWNKEQHLLHIYMRALDIVSMLR